ncbi:hypothetical protein [Actinotalea ferrariae]|nr:hypothetical protein [Actinotalea ferrariae]
MRLEPDDLKHWVVRPGLAATLLAVAGGLLGFTLPTIGALP